MPQAFVMLCQSPAGGEIVPHSDHADPAVDLRSFSAA